MELAHQSCIKIPEIIHNACSHWFVVEDDDAVILAQRSRGRLLATDLIKYLRPGGRHRLDVADAIAKYLQRVVLQSELDSNKCEG